MATINKNRLAREFEMLTKDPPPGIVARVAETSENDKDTRVDVVILGPAKTPYEGGRFALEVRLTPQYPFDAPSVRFVTKIFHPNVDESGRICLDSLKLPPSGAWRPSLNLVQVLSQIQILFGEPGLADPLRVEVAEMIKNDPQHFDVVAREWTAKYAMGDGGGHHQKVGTTNSSSSGDEKRVKVE